MPLLNQALGTLDRKLGDGGVLAWRTVEGRRDNFALNAALHVGDFFRTLVYQDNHQVALRVVSRDRVGDVLKNSRLTGLRRRNDQSPLTFTDRHNQINDSGGQDLRISFQTQTLVRVQRGQLGEIRTLTCVVDTQTIDGVDSHKRVVLLAVAAVADIGLLTHLDLTDDCITAA